MNPEECDASKAYCTICSRVQKNHKENRKTVFATLARWSRKTFFYSTLSHLFFVLIMH